MSDSTNLDKLASQLTQGTLASDLVSAYRDNVTPEDRALAMHAVLQRRLDVLVGKGTLNAENPSG